MESLVEVVAGRLNEMNVIWKEVWPRLTDNAQDACIAAAICAHKGLNPFPSFGAGCSVEGVSLFPSAFPDDPKWCFRLRNDEGTCFIALLNIRRNVINFFAHIEGRTPILVGSRIF
jgi:hypothetical protein